MRNKCRLVSLGVTVLLLGSMIPIVFTQNATASVIITITNPPSGTVAIGDANYPSGYPVRADVTATGGETINNVELEVDGSIVGTMTNIGGNTYEYLLNTIGFSDGNHNLRVKVTYNMNYYAYASRGVKFDNTPPSISNAHILYPTTMGVQQTAAKMRDKISVIATITDATAGVDPSNGARFNAKALNSTAGNIWVGDFGNTSDGSSGDSVFGSKQVEVRFTPPPNQQKLIGYKNKTIPTGPEATIWSDDFETDRGWTGYGGPGEWERRAPSGAAMPGDPTSAHSGSNIIGTDLSGLGTQPYRYEILNSTYYLTSPSINCSGRMWVKFSFYRWLRIESSWYDHASIDVSNDGTRWTNVWQHTGSTVLDNSWTLQVINISSVADDRPTVYVRFGIGRTDSSVFYTGWNIDDVTIKGTPFTVQVNPIYEVIPWPGDNYTTYLNVTDRAGNFRSLTLVVPVLNTTPTVPVKVIFPLGQSAAKFGDNVRIITDVSPQARRVPVDVILNIDDSGSMDWNDPGNLRVYGAQSFVRNLTPPDRVSVVIFGGYVSPCEVGPPDTGGTDITRHHLDHPDHDGPYDEVVNEDLDPTGYGAVSGTPMLEGMQLVNQEFQNYGNQSRRWFEILLTDGVPNSNVSAAIPVARALNITIFTIGLGSGVDAGLLRWIAKQTGGEYYFASDANALAPIYATISQQIKVSAAIKAANIYYAEANATSIGGWVREQMFDDGMHGDGNVNDSVFGTNLITVTSTDTDTKNVTVTAMDRAGHVAQGYYLMPVDNTPPTISSITFGTAGGGGGGKSQIWLDDFETNRGWTGYGGNGEWERGGVSPNPPDDPTSAYSGTNIIGTDLTGLGVHPYDYEVLPMTYWLTSPAIDCSGYTNVELRFYRWLQIGWSTYNHASVEVSNDGTTWTNVWQHTGSTVLDNSWTLQVIDISSVADGRPTVYVRFGIGPTSIVFYTGWNIDDVALFGRTAGGAGAVVQDGDVITVTAIITDPGTVGGITSARVDASSIGGGSAVPMSSTAGGAYISAPITVATGGRTGIFKLTVTAVDIAGNIATQDTNIGVDNAKLKAALSTPVENETIEARYTFRVSVSNPSVTKDVKLTVFGLTVPMSYNSQTGFYEYLMDTTTQPDERYTASANATDVVGQVIRTKVVWFYVDNHYPLLTVIYPVNGSYVSGIVNMRVTVVEKYLNYTQYDIDGNGWVDITTPWDTTVVAEGRHTLTIRAADKAGHITQQIQTVYVDNTNPTLSINAPATNEYIEGTYTFRVAVYDRVGIQTVTITVFGAPRTMNYNPQTGYWEYVCDTTTVRDDLYSATVTVVDKSGKTATATVSFYVDNNPPTLGFVNPKNEGTIVGGTIEIKVVSNDNFPPSRPTVEYRIDLSDYVAMTGGGPPSYEWSAFWDSKLVSDGNHTLTVRASDNAGHVVTASLRIVVDNNPPSIVAINQPGAKDQYLEGYYGFRVLANDSVGIAHVMLSIDNRTIDGRPNPHGRNLTNKMTCIKPNAEYLFELDTRTLGDGKYELIAIATDISGKRREARTTFYVDNNPPTVPSVNFPANVTFLHGVPVVEKDFTLTVGCTDIYFTPMVEYRADLGPWVTLSSTDGRSWTAIWKTADPTAPVADGLHNITIRATDPARLLRKEYVYTYLNIYTDNEAPVLSPTTNVPEEKQPPVHVRGIVVFEMKASDKVWLSEVNVKVRGGGEIAVQPTKLFSADGTTYRYELNTSRLRDNTQYTVTITAIDILGYANPADHITTFVRNIFVDNSPPEMIFTYPPEMNKTYLEHGFNGELVFIFVVTDESEVQGVYIRIDSGDWRPMGLDPKLKHKLRAYPGLSSYLSSPYFSKYIYAYVWETTVADNGVHHIEIKLVDKLGNTQIRSYNIRIENGDYSWVAVVIIVVMLLVLLVALYMSRRTKAIVHRPSAPKHPPQPRPVSHPRR